MTDDAPRWWFSHATTHGDLTVAWWRAFGGAWTKGTQVNTPEHWRLCYAEGWRRRCGWKRSSSGHAETAAKQLTSEIQAIR